MSSGSIVTRNFSFDSAVAKTFVIECATNLGAANWSAIETQTLSQPKLNFTDSTTNQNSGAFYRAMWIK